MAVKKCVICGKEFVDYGRGKYCNGPHYTKCQVCGKDFIYNPRLPVPQTCSHKCGSILGMMHPKFKSKICPQCGTSFIPSCGAQKFCSINCKEIFKSH